MYYPCSENKGVDQLRGYREADLRLCFRICRLLVFPRGGSIIISNEIFSYHKALKFKSKCSNLFAAELMELHLMLMVLKTNSGTVL